MEIDEGVMEEEEEEGIGMEAEEIEEEEAVGACMEEESEEQEMLEEVAASAKLGADTEAVADAAEADATEPKVDLDDADSPNDSFLVTLRSRSLSERTTG